MPEILIDSSNHKHLIDCFEQIFKTKSRTINRCQTILEFDNYLGKGTINIFPFYNDWINIKASLQLNQEINFTLINFDTASLNFLQVQKGYMHYSNAIHNYYVHYKHNNTLIKSANSVDKEILTIPKGSLLNLTFTKFFTLDALNELDEIITLNNITKSSDLFSIADFNIALTLNKQLDIVQEEQALKSCEENKFFDGLQRKKRVEFQLNDILKSIKKPLRR